MIIYCPLKYYTVTAFLLIHRHIYYSDLLFSLSQIDDCGLQKHKMNYFHSHSTIDEWG